MLAPTKPYSFGPVRLPAFGLGVYGLVYGVIIGAVLHLAIQVPGLVKYHFHWSASVSLKDERVRQVLRLVGPRLITMFFIQATFIGFALARSGGHFSPGLWLDDHASA